MSLVTCHLSLATCHLVLVMNLLLACRMAPQESNVTSEEGAENSWAGCSHLQRYPDDIYGDDYHDDDNNSKRQEGADNVTV